MTNANAVDAPALVPQKKCHQCHQMKDHSAFYRDKSKPTGRTSRCKECKESVAKTYRDENRERRLESIRRSNLKRMYGLSLEEYEEMHTLQNGCCAICLRPERMKNRYGLVRLAVDHDAVTGKVRGLLCRACNRSIGQLCHDPEILRRAAEYLEKP